MWNAIQAWIRTDSCWDCLCAICLHWPIFLLLFLSGELWEGKVRANGHVNPSSTGHSRSLAEKIGFYPSGWCGLNRSQMNYPEFILAEVLRGQQGNSCLNMPQTHSRECPSYFCQASRSPCNTKELSMSTEVVVFRNVSGSNSVLYNRGTP